VIYLIQMVTVTGILNSHGTSLVQWISLVRVSKTILMRSPASIDTLTRYVWWLLEHLGMRLQWHSIRSELNIGHAGSSLQMMSSIIPLK
jgi:hypothetical protein